jgi:tRNA nucleotidyltransferase/poly(A) polymerase
LHTTPEYPPPPIEVLSMSPLGSEPTVVQLDLIAAARAGQVIEYLRFLAQPVHLVGGTVRDLLLGRATRDLDVVVQADALALARGLADDLGGAFVSMDAARDTGRVVFGEGLDRQLVVDFAAWRGPTLDDDLRHRDFTVNALAAPIAQSQAEVIDVTGGLADLRHGLLRTAYDRSLADDPLRGLRAVRLVAELSSFGFRLEHGTAAALRDHAWMLAEPAPERIRDELVRILSAEAPDAWLRLMADLGQLPVVLPELAALRSVPDGDAFGRALAKLRYTSDLWRWIDGLVMAETGPDREMEQALESLRPFLAEHFASGDSRVRNRGQMWMWAALAQDWGLTKAQVGGHGDQAVVSRPARALQHVSSQLAADVLRRLRFNEAEVRRVATIVAHRLWPLDSIRPGDMPDRRTVHRYFQDTGDAGVEVALQSLADRQVAGDPAQGLEQWRWHVALVAAFLEGYFTQREIIIAPQPLVDGNDLMEALGLPPGQLVGSLLAEVAEAQAAGELHSREEALDLAFRLSEYLQRKT